MVELDKILSERSDERVLDAVKQVSDLEFAKLVEAVLGYLDLKVVQSKPKGSFVLVECIHRPDGKKYTVLFSRRDQVITKADITSLMSHMEKTESTNALVLTTSSVNREAASLAESNNIGVAEAAKLVALLRRFDLDKEVIRAAEVWKERAKVAAIPGADRQLEESMRLGYEAIANRDFMKALDHFDRAIMLREDYDVPWRMKGNVLDEMGYHEQALECYKHALDLFPESDETWFSLGACLFSLARYAEEIICYDRALQYNPQMQKAMINKGSTLHRLGRYQEALAEYDKVLKINFRLEKVHNNKGATLHSMGQLNDALASYNRAIELKHDYVEAWINKGSLLYEMGRYGEAYEALTEITHIRPELPKGWYLRGLASKKTGNISQAKASFEAALRLDPDYIDAKKALEDISAKVAEKFPEVTRLVKDIFESEAAKSTEPEVAAEKMKLTTDALARVREEKVEQLAEELYGDKAELLLLFSRFEEAFDFLGKSLRLEGENPHLLTVAGNVLFHLGKLEAAARTYEHAMEIDATYMPALFNLDTIALETGDSSRATVASESLRRSSYGWQSRTAASLDAFSKGDFKQALEDIEAALATEDLDALENYKGLLKLDLGDLAGAAQALEKTKTMPLDPAVAFNNCGVALLRKGDLEKASNELDKSIRLQRNNHAAWNNRGCVLYRLERVREAIACFDESAVMFPTTVALINKGFSQLAIDVVKDALQAFDQSLRIAETPEAYNNKGIAYERMGRHEEALASFKEALRMSPQFGDASDNARRVIVRTDLQKGVQQSGQSPPGEEVVGDKEKADSTLEAVSEDTLREMRKQELEAMCESLGIDAEGTRADLILRILKAKGKSKR